MPVSCAEHKQERRRHIFSVRVSNLGFKNPPGVSALTHGTTAYNTATGCPFYRVRPTRQLVWLVLRIQASYAVKLQ